MIDVNSNQMTQRVEAVRQAAVDVTQAKAEFATALPSSRTTAFRNLISKRHTLGVAVDQLLEDAKGSDTSTSIDEWRFEPDDETPAISTLVVSTSLEAPPLLVGEQPVAAPVDVADLEVEADPAAEG
jgi:hypothetical protein